MSSLKKLLKDRAEMQRLVAKRPTPARPEVHNNLGPIAWEPRTITLEDALAGRIKPEPVYWCTYCFGRELWPLRQPHVCPRSPLRPDPADGMRRAAMRRNPPPRQIPVSYPDCIFCGAKTGAGVHRCNGNQNAVLPHDAAAAEFQRQGARALLADELAQQQGGQP
jgi:hypothetical protein